MGFGSSVPRILVIDDERPIREMLTQMLERAGYEVETAENGEVGMSLLKKNPADLVIADMVMPLKEGIITIPEIRRDFPEVKVIAISGGGQGRDGAASEYLSIAARCGALRTFKKPLPRHELLTAIQELLKFP